MTGTSDKLIVLGTHVPETPTLRPLSATCTVLITVHFTLMMYVCVLMGR